jgi:membrane protein YqaA with SNARE-associated domain
MSLSEVLLFTFFDNFMGMLVVPIQGRIAVVVIKIFGNYPLIWVMVCAILGSISATIINWFFGRFAASAFNLKYQGEGWLQRFFGACRKYWYVMMTFSAVPFIGPLLVGLSGVSRIKPSQLLIGAMASNLAYYIILFVMV